VTDTTRSELLAKAHHIVIKLGSNVVAQKDGAIARPRLREHVQDIAELRGQGREVILITSGAVRVGSAKLGFDQPPPDLPARQAAAAVGQAELMWCYRDLFERQGLHLAQVLLTQGDISDRGRYLHLRNTLSSLLHDYRVVPVINENDTVSVEGIRFGENDKLAALIAVKVDADLLMLLSDVEGLFTADPRFDQSAVLVDTVTEISEELEAQAAESGTSTGTGGMRAKIEAAKVAMHSGVPMVIAPGHRKHIIRRVVAGEPVGTLFVPRAGRMRARMRWLAYATAPRGRVVVDQGAVKALTTKGSSLLPVGVTAVVGEFRQGDPVTVVDAESNEIARGLANYGSADLRQICGCRTGEIARKLGHRPYDEVIHRDNLVLL